jgi:hypothetical protein
MNIIKSFGEFECSNINLSNPIRMQGGSYYSKILLNNNNTFFVQTPKCTTKNGIIETGKRIYTDIMLQPEQQEFIQFILDVEMRIKQILQEKNNTWFENSMDDDDIEYFFNTNLKTYKQQNYLFRTFISNSKTLTSLHNIQIYDNNEEEMSFTDVKDKPIISIFHFKGVKFTSSSFHIDVELKQIMILNEEQIFSKKLISLNNKPIERNTVISSNELSNEPIVLEDNDQTNLEAEAVTTIDNVTGIEDNIEEGNLEKSEEKTLDMSLNKTDDISDSTVENEDLGKIDLVINTLESEELEKQELEKQELEKQDLVKQDEESEKDEQEEDAHSEQTEESVKDEEDVKSENTGSNDYISNKSNNLEEFTLTIDDSETIQLKNPNEVYQELYRKAKQRAKDAKKQAIIAYLEAKHIKKTYMLEDLDDSSSDEDEDYDNISEMSYEDLE